MDFRSSLRSQRGSALIFAVGMCTLVVILATSMILSLHHDMRRFERLNDSVAELAAAQSATAWATTILSDDNMVIAVDKRYEVDLNGIQMSATLIDIDGLFNINALINNDDQEGEQSAQAVFERLIASLGVDNAFVGPLQRDATPLVYLSQMKSSFDVPQASYDVLLPYVRLSPEGERTMNVNTMPPVLLAAVLDIEEGAAEAILALGPFESSAQFNEALSQLSIEMPSEGVNQWLKYNSQQYLVHARMQAKGITEVYTLLAPSENEWRVVYQSTGVRL